jgi:hypothetical protein
MRPHRRWSRRSKQLPPPPLPAPPPPPPPPPLPFRSVSSRSTSKCCHATAFSTAAARARLRRPPPLHAPVRAPEPEPAPASVLVSAPAEQMLVLPPRVAAPPMQSIRKPGGGERRTRARARGFASDCRKVVRLCVFAAFVLAHVVGSRSGRSDETADFQTRARLIRLGFCDMDVFMSQIF